MADLDPIDPGPLTLDGCTPVVIARSVPAGGGTHEAAAEPLRKATS